MQKRRMEYNVPSAVAHSLKERYQLIFLGTGYSLSTTQYQGTYQVLHLAVPSYTYYRYYLLKYLGTTYLVQQTAARMDMVRPTPSRQESRREPVLNSPEIYITFQHIKLLNEGKDFLWTKYFSGFLWDGYLFPWSYSNLVCTFVANTIPPCICFLFGPSLSFCFDAIAIGILSLLFH